MKDGGAAFPQHGWTKDPETLERMKMQGGMSLREYSAIHLRVANSGVDWLDEMIEKANRDWFAGQALNGFSLRLRDNGWPNQVDDLEVTWVSKAAYTIADAMLAEREKEDQCE